jgi:hypothetical protein
MIECEVSSHEAYGTPRDLFIAVIAATLRELLCEDWSPPIDAAWQQLLAELQDLIAQSQLRR